MVDERSIAQVQRGGQQSSAVAGQPPADRPRKQRRRRPGQRLEDEDEPDVAHRELGHGEQIRVEGLLVEAGAAIPTVPEKAPRRLRVLSAVRVGPLRGHPGVPAVVGVIWLLPEPVPVRDRRRPIPKEPVVRVAPVGVTVKRRTSHLGRERHTQGERDREQEPGSAAGRRRHASGHRGARRRRRSRAGRPSGPDATR